MPRFDEDLVITFNDTEVARIDASSGNLTLGAEGRDGDIVLRDKAGNNRIHLSAAAQLFLGARGQDGNLIVRDKHGDTVFINGDNGLGT